jgi:xanthine dehydrogenase accessory factor
MSLNRATRRAAEAWAAEGRPGVVVVVLETRGSAPRKAGTRMLVGATQTVGTIGGGHLELKAIQEARAMLGGGVPPHQVHYPLGPALGQCCGGAMTVGFTRLDAQAIDERADMFPPALFEGQPWPEQIKVVPVDQVWGEVATAPEGAYYLVLTHSHDLDLKISETILKRGDFGYFGLIGSETKRARFIHRFEERGIAMQRIARMTCPIGIEGIAAKEPEIIAVSVVAQLLQE